MFGYFSEAWNNVIDLMNNNASTTQFAKLITRIQVAMYHIDEDLYTEFKDRGVYSVQGEDFVVLSVNHNFKSEVSLQMQLNGATMFVKVKGDQATVTINGQLQYLIGGE